MQRRGGDKVNAFYTPFIGFPLAVILFTIGLMFCLTIIGIPLGFACFSAANRFIALRR